MQAAGLAPYEAVLIRGLNNGNRIETYVVPGQAGSGNVSDSWRGGPAGQERGHYHIIGFGYWHAREAAGDGPAGRRPGREQPVLNRR